MDRFVDWKRNQIKQKHIIQIAWVLGFFIVTPIAIGIISYLWQFALRSIIE